MLRSLYALTGIILIAGAVWLGCTSGECLVDASKAPSDAPMTTAPDALLINLTPDSDEYALAATTLDDGTLRLENPDQALTADYTRDGVAMTAGADTPASWTLRTTAVGYGTTMTDLPEAEPRAMGNYLEYVRGDVIEWYVNRADGIEQGYTVIAPPTGADGTTRLAVQIEVAGELDLEVQEHSQLVALRDADDNAVLAMSDFLAYDARGTMLPMTVIHGEHPNAIRFEVDDRRAYYPVTIDPMFRRGALAPVLEWVDDNRDGTCTAHFGYVNTVGKWSVEDIQAWKDRRAPACRYEQFVERVVRVRAKAEEGRPWAIRWLEDKAEKIEHLDSLPEYQEWHWQRFLSHRSDRARQRIHEGRRVSVGTQNNYFSPAPARRGQPRHFEAGRQVDVFQVVFSEDSIVWNLCGRTSTASKSAAHRSVRPILEYVQENSDGTYTAHWGYLNENRNPVSIPAGNDNKITPNGPDHGQVTTFQVGRVHDAFQTDFPGGRQNWTLEGPDGRRRVACAGADNARPYLGEAIKIFNTVFENSDGTFTAVFGYVNQNDHLVTIPIGPDNRLSPSDHNGPQNVDFIADRMEAAWTITWPGDHNLVWTVTGPDNRTRTTCAGVDAAVPYDPEPANSAPVFTSSAHLSVAENSSIVMTLTATDVDGDPVTFSISGGDDAALFSIDGSGGELTFASAPNFESPGDADGDNVYEVTVRVSDGALSDTQILSVTVVNEIDGTYLLIDVSAGPDISTYSYSERDAAPSDLLTNDVYKTDTIVLRKIPAGSFSMGSPTDELGRASYETQHQVTLTQDYYLGIFEITQAQWMNVMGSNPSYFTGDTRPVERVSWTTVRGGAWAGAAGGDPAASSFMGLLSSKAGIMLDLPTEAQWEYACRAGTTTALNNGENLSSGGSDANMDLLGRYSYNRGSSQHAVVGSYQPNAWDLYDMHGNVYEWCLDWYDNYSSDAATDPVGPASGSYRVRRGGSWHYIAQLCRSANRNGVSPHVANSSFGFRLAAPGQPVGNG